MKKKLLSLVLIIAMIAALTACGGKNVSLSYDLPEGFTEDANTEGMYYGPDYPSDTSNIYVQVVEDDPYGVNLTEEFFTESVISTYESQGFAISDFNVAEFTTGEMDGYDTLLIEYSYSLSGIEIWQMEFGVQIGKKTYFLIYTQPAGFGWEDEFRASVNSVQIVKE